MPPPPGPRVPPGTRQPGRGGGSAGRQAGGPWHDGRAAPSLACSCSPRLALPAALASQPRARHWRRRHSRAVTGERRDHRHDAPAGRPGATITVTGTLSNVSRQQISHLSVQLLGVEHTGQQRGRAAAGAAPWRMAWPARTSARASWPMAGQLQPGATVRWSIQVKAERHRHDDLRGVPAGRAGPERARGSATCHDPTYLPYVPARKGPYGSSIPARTKISWVWPLIDKPLLNQPWAEHLPGPAGAGAERWPRSLGRHWPARPACRGGARHGARARASPGRSTRPCWPT